MWTRARLATASPTAFALAAGVALGCATGETVNPPRDADSDSDSSCPGGCPPGQRCVGGRCVGSSCGSGACPGGDECCDSVCTDVRTDLHNCGACSNDCEPRGNGCFSGVCACNGAAACDEGRTCCGEGRGCVDTLSDPSNCGECGIPCTEGSECLAGACGGSCLTGCPDVPHGRTACAGERCEISTCDPGWADVDGLLGNGCECEVAGGEESGDTCDTAFDLGSIPDTGGTLEATGTVLPVTDEDWFQFTATDATDTACDEFYVDIRFEENPEDQYEFEVYVPDCGTSLCTGDTRFSYAIDMNSTGGTEILGQCPCTAESTAGLNICSDDTKTFRVKVRRADPTGTGTCAGYRLVITNGVHSTASP